MFGRHAFRSTSEKGCQSGLASPEHPRRSSHLPVSFFLRFEKRSLHFWFARLVMLMYRTGDNRLKLSIESDLRHDTFPFVTISSVQFVLFKTLDTRTHLHTHTHTPIRLPSTRDWCDAKFNFIIMKTTTTSLMGGRVPVGQESRTSFFSSKR